MSRTKRFQIFKAHGMWNAQPPITPLTIFAKHEMHEMVTIHHTHQEAINKANDWFKP